MEKITREQFIDLLEICGYTLDIKTDTGELYNAKPFCLPPIFVGMNPNFKEIFEKAFQDAYDFGKNEGEPYPEDVL